MAEVLKGIEEKGYMAVADIFDALVSKRCYKESMSASEAFRVIRESGGSHFAPELVRIFSEIRGEVEKVLGTEEKKAEQS